MPKVIFLTSLPPDLAKRLTANAPSDFEVSVHSSRLSDPEKIGLIRDADFLILFGGQVSEMVLRSTINLRLIQLVSAGFEHMDLPLCRELGIPIANNGGSNSIDVSEHTLSLILGFYRHLGEQDQNVRSEKFSEINTGRSTYTIHGKTAGIIGLGNIGQKVTRLLTAFGATCLYYDAYPASDEIEKALGVSHVSLDELLKQSDIVTLHVPLNDQTNRMIGKRELELMKPTALLVNTCRGNVINQIALTETLQNRSIMGAALDVLEQEPPGPDDPILTLDNVLLTPHSAGVTFDTWSRRGEFVFENLQRVWKGESPLALVRES